MGLFDDVIGETQSQRGIGSGLFNDVIDKQEEASQDSALTRGITQAKSAAKTAKALSIGDYETVAQLAAERDAYRKANPGTKEGNELISAWDSGDGIAMQGKNPNEHRFIKGDNVKVYNDMGQVIGEQQGGFFDTATMQPVGQPQRPVTTKEEVDKAIASGKITKEQAAARIKAAGGNPKDYGL